MSIVLNKEQLMIQKMAKEFARKDLSIHAAERDRNHEFPKESLKKMGELGFMGMLVSEEYEGGNFGPVAYSLALTEIAYGCASTAVVMSVHNSVCCGSLQKYGNEEQKHEFLRKMAKGKMICAFAITEPEAGSDPQGMECSAVRNGDHYIINGTKRFISTGKNSDVIILIARTKETGTDGISAFLITHDLPGFEVGRIIVAIDKIAHDHRPKKQARTSPIQFSLQFSASH